MPSFRPVSALLAPAALLLASCAPSPLYVGRQGPGTPGEVPRDGRGEPIWAAIPPAPPLPASEVPAPPAAPGQPVQPVQPLPDSGYGPG